MLASASPQRRALLGELGVPFAVHATDVEEIEHGGDPARIAVENALRKARAASAARRSTAPEAVIGCDTIVVLDGTIYGKPRDEAQARATLGALQGRTHEVISGLAVVLPAEERTALARTFVTFRTLGERELEAYVATGEWRGRSGGYAIQRGAARLALAIEGPEDNVIGLPLATLQSLYPELSGS